MAGGTIRNSGEKSSGLSVPNSSVRSPICKISAMNCAGIQMMPSSSGRHRRHTHGLEGCRISCDLLQNHCRRKRPPAGFSTLVTTSGSPCKRVKVTSGRRTMKSAPGRLNSTSRPGESLASKALPSIRTRRKASPSLENLLLTRQLAEPGAPPRRVAALRAVQDALQQATSSGGRYSATLVGTIVKEAR